MGLPPYGPEPYASANSATPACAALLTAVESYRTAPSRASGIFARTKERQLLIFAQIRSNPLSFLFRPLALSGESWKPLAALCSSGHVRRALLINPLIYTPRAKRSADTEDSSALALSFRECGERTLEC